MNLPVLVLNDGHEIPQLGIGTWPLSSTELPAVLETAFEAGYRHVDTAAAYGNEVGVGEGVRATGLRRDELFVTTKIGNDDHGFGEARRALDESLERLGLDYVDLALIHWPMPAKNQFERTWDALVTLREEGKARSIGVSNFRPEHLDRIIRTSGVTPAVNQIEVNPVVSHRELRAATTRRGIVVESWSPLGPGTGLLQDSRLQGVAEKHNKTVGQVVIRWHIQNNLVVIPKSATPQRIRENIDVFDFQLDDDDLLILEAFDQGHPATYSAHLAGG